MPASLAERLRERIRREGPMTFHDWMKAALYDPDGGYYQRSDLRRWGMEGDYRTSPERSELFAATFASYLSKLYVQLDSWPGKWTIVECGAGDGRFAAGVLRTLADRFPDLFAATQYVVSELSDDARRRAQKRLIDFAGQVEFCSDLPPVKCGIYFSNELLDAFPVHRVIKNVGLSELYVDVSLNGDFEWIAGPLSTPRLAEFCSTYSVALAPAQIIEINLDIDDWFYRVAEKLKQGFVITVDYGAEAGQLYDPWQRRQGTLRAFSRHGFVDNILARPGEVDITASVNWTQVKRVGERLGLKVIDFVSQDKFLLHAGLLGEMKYRTAAAGAAEKAVLSTGAREMILPGGMASNFQVLIQERLRNVARVQAG